MRILVVNIGSSSRKYACYDQGALQGSAKLETAADGMRGTFRDGEGGNRNAIRETMLSPEEYAEGTQAFLDFLSGQHRLAGADGLDAIALRVVAPGTFFQRNRIVDEEYLGRLETAGRWAPLHVRPVWEEARRLRSRYPRLRILAVSDSAFHAALPGFRRHYALPAADADRWDLFRFGYHGISVQSVLRKAAASAAPASRVIVCHLGSGASITAVRDGRSVATSMGFSPLEGLVMGTRPGDLDPGAVLYLAKATGMGPDELEGYLNARCGLLGLSGISADMRVLLAREAEGHAGARLAAEAFVDRARQYIGAYHVVLGGLDLLAFTGGIGENSEAIRDRICAGLEGTVLMRGAAGGPRTGVIVSGEMEEMARQAAEFVAS